MCALTVTADGPALGGERAWRAHESPAIAGYAAAAVIADGFKVEWHRTKSADLLEA